VTLRSSGGGAGGFGFDICGDAGGAIAVQSLQSGGPAHQSGLIQPGLYIPRLEKPRFLKIFLGFRFCTFLKFYVL